MSAEAAGINAMPRKRSDGPKRLLESDLRCDIFHAQLGGILIMSFVVVMIVQFSLSFIRICYYEVNVVCQQ